MISMLIVDWPKEHTGKRTRRHTQYFRLIENNLVAINLFFFVLPLNCYMNIFITRTVDFQIKQFYLSYCRMSLVRFGFYLDYYCEF